MSFTIGLAQIDPVLGDLGANVAKHVLAAEHARREKADLIVFPELSLTGYTTKDMTRDLAVNMSLAPAVLNPLLELSKSISIIAGGVEEDSSYRLFNSAFLFEGGTVRSVHRKIYLPTYGMFEEMRYFSPGTSLQAHSSRVGLLGILICEDLWHIALPYLLAQQGAPVIIGLVASPTRLSGDQQRLEIASANGENHRAYARLLSSYVVFCNRTGFEDGVGFWGGSTVTGPDGTQIISAKYFEEDLVVARIEDQELRRARQISRHFLDDDPRFLLNELRRIGSNRP